MSDTAALSTSDLASLVSALAAMTPAAGDADRIERVRQFENLKAAVAAAQALETAGFVAAQKAAQAADGVPPSRQGRGVAAQVALARRISPHQAQRYTGWTHILTSELPHTFAQLQAGRITEWRALLVARETIWLSREDRALVDAELAPQLEGWGDKQVEAETRRAAYRLDPAGSVARSRNAAKDRRVSVRPAPDTMARLSALLPVAQAVACYATLKRKADLTTAGGDERGRGQIMADTLVERLTGQATADAVPVEIELVMTDTTLFGHPTTDATSTTNSTGTGTVTGGGEAADVETDTVADGDTDKVETDTAADIEDDVDEVDAPFETEVSDAADEPGFLVGFGPIPAELARELALGSAATDTARRRIRRLFLHPTTGQLAAMDTEARLFTRNERRFIRYRDHGTCRTPWCGAPIRHADHIQPHAQGGPTSVTNGQGLCEACNYARQAPGWHSRVLRDGTIITFTPTGRHYRSRLPAPPGCPAADESPVERELRARLFAA